MLSDEQIHDERTPPDRVWSSELPARQLSFHFMSESYRQMLFGRTTVESLPYLRSTSIRGIFRHMFLASSHSDFEQFTDLLYRMTRPAKRVTDADAEVVERLERVEAQQEHLRNLMEHAVRPALAKLAGQAERYYQEKDPIPAAASAEYEWRRQAQKASKVAEELIADFDDLPTRLSNHATLISYTKELLKVARSLDNRNLISAVLTVHDALYSVFSEHLSLEQSIVIRDSILKLQNVEWDRHKVRELDKFLREAGFETVPSDKFLGSYNATRSA